MLSDVPLYSPPMSVYETILGVLIANFIFIYLSVFYTFFTENKQNIRLILLAIFSLTLLGFPSFYMPNLVNDLVIFLVLAVYPSILAIMKLKYKSAFERYKKYLIGLSISFVALYVVYNEIYFPVTAYLPYPLYALAVAVPEFFIIFVDDITTAVQLIVTYESLLNMFLLVPYVIAGNSGLIQFVFTAVTPMSLFLVAFASFILSLVEKKHQLKFLILHMILSFVFLGSIGELVVLYYLQSPY